MTENTHPLLLVVGLDGATFDLIEPMAARGELPTMARLMAEGAWGSLRSTTPPVSPQAWSSFLTGVRPGRHAIFGFQGPPEGRFYRRPILSSQDVQSPTVLDLLGRAGRRVGAFGVPMTYPPGPVNGVLVPEQQGPPLSYPPGLWRELVAQVGDPRDLATHVPYLFTQDKRGYLAELQQALETQCRAAHWLLDREPFDLFVVVFTVADRAAHFLWKYADVTHPGYPPELTVTYQLQPTVREGRLDNTATLNHASLGTPIVATATTGVDSSYLLSTSGDPGCSTTFYDVSGSGTALSFVDYADAITVTMPFEFTFYGESSDRLIVGNRGGIRFNPSSAYVSSCDFGLMGRGDCDPMGIYPWSDDIGNDLGGVYYATVGSAPNRRFIVQWDDREIRDYNHNNEGNQVTFQTVFYEGSHRIDFVYADVVVTGTQASHTLGRYASVGLKKDDSQYIQYWSFYYMDAYSGRAVDWGYSPRLYDGLAVCFEPYYDVYLPVVLRNSN